MENIQRFKCPILPDLAPVIPVVCQPPSPFFATLPQSHMEAGLRWVESTTFLLITSKLGDLLGVAWGLALQPPSVNCSSSLLWPRWWWMASDKVQTRFTVCKCSREQLGELAVSYWQMGQRKHPRSLFVHGKQKGRIISLMSLKMSAERGKKHFTFPEPSTTLQIWNPCSYDRGKRVGKETGKRIREDRTYWLMTAHMQCLNWS